MSFSQSSFKMLKQNIQFCCWPKKEFATYINLSSSCVSVCQSVRFQFLGNILIKTLVLSLFNVFLTELGCKQLFVNSKPQCILKKVIVARSNVHSVLGYHPFRCFGSII